MKRKALGRGLSALIPDATNRKTSVASADFFQCPVEKIKPNKTQPRQYFDDDKLNELVASIKDKGIVQPLVVRSIRGGLYEIVVGERRWRAAQKAGLREVPVVIRSINDRDAFEIALVENIHRADLDPIDEAEAYQHLLSEHGYTQDQLAKKLGRDRTTLTNALRLLKLPAKTQRALRSAALSPGHGRALLALERASAIDSAAKQIIAKQLSVRQTEALVRALKAPAREPVEPPTISANEKHLQERLARSLKTRVKLISQRNNRGRIEISYNSLDELDRLLEVLLK